MVSKKNLPNKKPRPAEITSRYLTTTVHYTFTKTAVFDGQATLLLYTIKNCYNFRVEPGKYTSNCRENKAGTNLSYSWKKSII